MSKYESLKFRLHSLASVGLGSYHRSYVVILVRDVTVLSVLLTHL